MTSPASQGNGCVVFIGVDLDGISVEKGLGVEPLGKYSLGRYAYDWGVPRYLDLFRRHGVAVTFFVPGYDAEVAPQLIRRIAEEGHEVAAHGYQHEPTYLERTVEADLLRRTHLILTEVVGEAPRGWRNPGGIKSESTHALLANLGYLYDSSDKDREEPFVYRGPQAALVELPTNTATLDDGYLNEVALLAPSRVLKIWTEEFDYASAENQYFPLILHGRALWGSGTPSRIRVVEALIEHMRSRPRTEFVVGTELAERVLRVDAPNHEWGGTRRG